MRISDWSSDVCSSDLRIVAGEAAVALAEHRQRISQRLAARLLAQPATPDVLVERLGEIGPPLEPGVVHGGRARELRSDERRVGKSVSVRVDIGGRRHINKKKAPKSSYDAKCRN